MPTSFLSGKPAFHARAMLIGERLHLKTMEAGDSLALTPLAVAVEGGGIAVLFRYGAVVLFGVDEAAEAAFLERLAPLTRNAYPSPLIEEIGVRIDPRKPGEIKGSVVYVAEVTMERLQVIADVLAKSTVLALYET